MPFIADLTFYATKQPIMLMLSLQAADQKRLILSDGWKLNSLRYVQQTMHLLKVAFTRATFC